MDAPASSDQTRRRFAVIGTIAVVAIAVVGVVVATRSDDSSDVVSGPTSSIVDTTAVPTSVPAATTTTEPVPSSTTTAPATTTTTTAPPVTTAPPAVDPGALPGVEVAYEFECRDGFVCTQFDEAPSGAIIATDPDGTSLRRYESDRVDDFEIALPEGLAFGSGAWLLTVGPDDVAYLVVDQVPYVDPIQDVLAVATTGPRAGEVVESWDGVIDGSGDTDYVPTAAGLVTVGCCNFDPIRPEPGASPVIEWVDSTGQPTTSPGPFATISVGEGGNTLTIADAGGSATYPLSVFAEHVRGMPSVDVLADGTVLLGTFNQVLYSSVISVYTLDDAGEFDFVGVGETIVLSTAVTDLDDSRPRVVEVLRSGDVLAAIGTELRLIGYETLFDAVGSRGWDDSARADNWEVTAAGLNEFIAAEQPQWAADPFVFGAMLVQNWYPNEQTLVEVSDPSLDPFDADGLAPGATGEIIITTSGFLDDSVEASQWTITVEVADDGLLRFVSGTSAQRCQPNRGHQDFQPELCL